MSRISRRGSPDAIECVPFGTVLRRSAPDELLVELNIVPTIKPTHFVLEEMLLMMLLLFRDVALNDRQLSVTDRKCRVAVLPCELRQHTIAFGFDPLGRVSFHRADDVGKEM